MYTGKTIFVRKSSEFIFHKFSSLNDQTIEICPVYIFRSTFEKTSYNLLFKILEDIQIMQCREMSHKS